MPEVLIAADAEWVHEEVHQAVGGGDTVVRSVWTGPAVRDAVAERKPDLVIVDCQIGSMGGIAVTIDLRLEEGAGRLPAVPVLVLLDRRADVFLARRSGAEGWLVKPFDALRLRRAVRALLGGGTYEDPSYAPPTVAAAEAS